MDWKVNEFAKDELDKSFQMFMKFSRENAKFATGEKQVSTPFSEGSKTRSLSFPFLLLIFFPICDVTADIERLLFGFIGSDSTSGYKYLLQKSWDGLVVDFTNWKIASKIFSRIINELLSAYETIEKIGRKYFKNMAAKIVPYSDIYPSMQEILSKNTFSIMREN